jgi:predicted DsbA family dithiol-disulfide isomerase
MHVHIWSDIVCPWCYLGKRRLERALESFEHRDDITIVHRSFQLDPSRPRGKTTKRREMLSAKYRLTPEQVETLDAKMERTAAADGLTYHLTGEGVTGNTFDAHRLLQLAKVRGRQDQMLERLYRAYFTEQRSIFDTDSLVTLAEDAGLQRDEARRVLEGAEYGEAVTEDVSEALLLGVSGVPFFAIDDRFAVSGAQSVDVFRQALTRAWETRTTAS